MSECPCRDCPNRKIGCHGKCEKYQGWNKEHSQLNKNIRRKKHQKGIGWLGEHYRKPSKCKGELK